MSAANSAFLCCIMDRALSGLCLLYVSIKYPRVDCGKRYIHNLRTWVMRSHCSNRVSSEESYMEPQFWAKRRKCTAVSEVERGEIVEASKHRSYRCLRSSVHAPDPFVFASFTGSFCRFLYQQGCFNLSEPQCKVCLIKLGTETW